MDNSVVTFSPTPGFIELATARDALGTECKEICQKLEWHALNAIDVANACLGLLHELNFDPQKEPLLLQMRTGFSLLGRYQYVTDGTPPPIRTVADSAEDSFKQAVVEEAMPDLTDADHLETDWITVGEKATKSIQNAEKVANYGLRAVANSLTVHHFRKRRQQLEKAEESLEFYLREIKHEGKSAAIQKLFINGYGEVFRALQALSTTAFNLQDLGPQNTEKSRQQIAQSVYAASSAVAKAVQHVRYALDHLEFQRQKLIQLRTLSEEDAAQLEEISRRMQELKRLPDQLSAVQEAHNAQFLLLAPAAPISSMSRRPTY